MIDNDMTNILSNFSNVGSDKPMITDAKTGEQKVNLAAKEQNAMKALLEGLDSAQNSVNQMPSTHKMAKNTATKHPASEYLVGGEEGEVPEGEAQLDEVDIAAWEAKRNKVEETQSVEEGFESPRAIAMELEAMRANNEKGVQEIMDNSPEPYRALMYTLLPNAEDIDGTKAYHDIVDELESIWSGDPVQTTIESSGNLRTVEVTFDNGEALKTNVAADQSDMQIYDYYKVGKRFNLGDGAGGDRMATVQNVEILGSTVSEDTLGHRKSSTDVHKKQSLADIFRSMDETSEDMETRFKRELHDEIQDTVLKKDNAGKSELAEDASDAIFDLQAAIRNLTHFAVNDLSVKEEFKVNNGDTFIVLAKKVVRAVKEIRGGKS